MTIHPEVFIRRQKLRRKFETEFKKINSYIIDASKKAGVEPFYIKYSDHLLDRAIQREIDEEYVFELFKQLRLHVIEVNKFLQLPAMPIENADPNMEYRPLRLEITDNVLWLGMTVDIKKEGKPNSLKCRMAFINNKRLQGKTSKKVIYLK